MIINSLDKTQNILVYGFFIYELICFEKACDITNIKKELIEKIKYVNVSMMYEAIFLLFLTGKIDINQEGYYVSTKTYDK